MFFRHPSVDCGEIWNSYAQDITLIKSKINVDYLACKIIWLDSNKIKMQNTNDESKSK
jgi:hypothetical protein